MTSFDRKHLWEIQAIRDVLLIAGGLSLLWLGYALSSITIPLLMALLLAYLVEPLVEGLASVGFRVLELPHGSLACLASWWWDCWPWCFH